MLTIQQRSSQKDYLNRPTALVPKGLGQRGVVWGVRVRQADPPLLLDLAVYRSLLAQRVTGMVEQAAKRQSLRTLSGEMKESALGLILEPMELQEQLAEEERNPSDLADNLVGWLDLDNLLPNPEMQELPMEMEMATVKVAQQMNRLVATDWALLVRMDPVVDPPDRIPPLG
jgi:hypothetical protein